MALRTDYKDDVLDTSVNNNRVYVIKDSSGAILYEGATIEEITKFEQEGSSFGAADINATNEAVNEINNNLEELQKKGTWEEILFSTNSGVKELSKSLSNFTQIAIVNENGSGDVAFSCETYSIEAFKRYTNRAQTYESGTTYVYCKYVDDTHINITGIGSNSNARIFGVY